MDVRLHNENFIPPFSYVVLVSAVLQIGPALAFYTGVPFFDSINRAPAKTESQGRFRRNYISKFQLSSSQTPRHNIQHITKANFNTS